MSFSSRDVLGLFADATEPETEGSSLGFLRRHPSLIAELAHLLPTERRPPPAKLGGYRIQSEIGRGGMAVVYAATHESTDETVALKVVSEHDGEACRMLIREAEVLAEIRHPHVVAVREHGLDAGFAWLCMELIEGRTLAGWLGDPRTEPSQPPGDPSRNARVLAWADQIAGGLAVLHETGLVHRDVKPSNIVLREDGSACLIDFGLARGSDDESGQRVLAGTIPYMSPEQTLEGLVAVDPASDVYALAATIHEALSGCPVASVADRATVLEEVAFRAVPPLSTKLGVSRELIAVLARALSKDRSRRHRSAAEFLADLRAVQSGELPVHTPLGGWRRLMYTVRRHQALVAVLVICLGAYITLAFWSERRAAADCRVQLDSVRRLLTRAELIPALAALQRARDEFDGRQEIEEFLVRHGPELSDRIAGRLLGQLGFVVAGTNLAPNLESLFTWTSILRNYVDRNSSTFSEGLRRFLMDGEPAAREWLGGLGPVRDPRLIELSALLACGVGDVDEFERLDALAASRSSADATVRDLSLRSYRHAVAAMRARVDPAFESIRADQLDRSRSLLEQLTALGASEPLHWITVGLVALEDGAFDQAAAVFERLLETQPSVGARLHRVLAEGLSTDRVTDSSRDSVREAARHLRQADAPLWFWLTLTAASYRRFPLASRMLEASSPPPDGTRFAMIRAGVSILSRLLQDEDFERALGLGDRLIGWALDSTEDGLATLKPVLGSLTLWTPVHAAHALIKAGVGDDADVVRLVTAIRERAERGPAPADATAKSAVLALADLFEAEIETDANRRRSLLERGRRRADAVLRAGPPAATADLVREVLGRHSR